MSDMTSPADAERGVDGLDDLLETHVSDPRRTFQPACRACVEPWPCRTYQLIHWAERLRQQKAALRDALEKTVQALEWGQTRLPNSGHMMFGQPLIAARAALAEAEQKPDRPQAEGG